MYTCRTSSYKSGILFTLKRGSVKSAPRKVRKKSAGENPVYATANHNLTTSIEATTALEEVTNLMKPVGTTYQAPTKVKVLSSEMNDNVEADVFLIAEGSMKVGAMVSHHSLYRGLSPLQDMRWSLRKLGRSSMLSFEYAGTSQNRQELANGLGEVGLIDSTRSVGKLCTWGSDQQYGGCVNGNWSNTRRLW